MRNYLFIFYKHLPLHSSLHSNSLLWSSGFGTKCWRHSTEGWEIKAQGWEAVVISRHNAWNTGPVWAADVAMHTMLQFLVGRLSLSPGDALVGSCIVTLNLLILPCCLMGIPQLKDLPNELIWNKAMSMPFQDYLMHLRMLTPPSLRHIQYWHRLRSIIWFCLVQRESKLYSNSSMCLSTNPMTRTQQYMFSSLYFFLLTATYWHSSSTTSHPNFEEKFQISTSSEDEATSFSLYDGSPEPLRDARIHSSCQQSMERKNNMLWLICFNNEKFYCRTLHPCYTG